MLITKHYFNFLMKRMCLWGIDVETTSIHIHELNLKYKNVITETIIIIFLNLCNQC